MNGMQGLLNMLGGGSMMGMQDFLSPEQQRAIQQQSMMAMAAKLLQAGGPSTTRTSLGQALGGAFEAGQGAMQSGQTNAVQQMLLGQKIQESQAQQKRSEDFAKLLSGGAPTQTPAALTPEQALLAPDAGPVGPTQQRADMTQPPPAAQTQPSPQAVSSMMPNTLQLLSPEQRALLGTMPVDKAQEQLFNVTQEAMKFGDPKPENRGGKTVMVARNGFGQERILEGVQPFEATPTSIREYQFALSQGFRGSLQDFITAKAKAGAARQTVNVGDTQFGPTSTDMMRVPDPDAPGGVKIIPIAGGKAAQQIAQDATAKEVSSQVTMTAAQTVFEDAGRAIEVLDSYGNVAGGIGALSAVIPSTPARELRGHIESIKGNIGIDQLLKIKQSGAGLGAIPQAQLEMLAGLLGNLDAAQNPRVLRQNIQRVMDIYADIVRKEGGDPQQLAQERGFLTQTPSSSDQPQFNFGDAVQNELNRRQGGR